MRRRKITLLRAPARIDTYDPREWESVRAYEEAVAAWQARNPRLMTPLGAFQRRLAARRFRRNR